MADQFALTWDLDSLMPNPATDQFQSVFATFQADLEQLADRSEQLPPAHQDHAAEWVDFLKAYEDIDARTGDLGAFVGCHAAGDAENTTYQQMEAALAALTPLRSQIATNIEFAFKAASDQEFHDLLEADPWLKEISFSLTESRDYAALRLPKEQEMLFAELAVDGLHAWDRLYDRISGSLRVSVMEKGEVVEKSVSQVQMDSAERLERQNNFYASNKAWDSIADICAEALNHLSGTRLTRYKRLGLEDHLTVPLKYNRMKRETLNAMWDTISARKSMMTTYLKAKAKLLGIDELTWYDMMAPLPSGGAGGNAKLTWDQACHTVIDTFEGFSPEFGGFAKRSLEERWIEAENRPGKRQGGFCTGFPTKKQSRIFMTFTDSPDSMSTLAHEIGHAYHSYVLRDRPLFLQHYPMGLAETASTFAEAVLGDQRLKQADQKSEQLSILDNMLSDAVAFLMNIHARFLFEDRFHIERAKGELTTDRFKELMVEAQKDAYENVLAEDGWNPLFWASKLHFYISGYPFYNFPYTFGYLLSLGVYALSEEAGDSFPEQYRELLIATGCQNAEDAVHSTFGYDLTQPDFWNKSLDIVQSRVDQYVELVES